jgi:hypothetical protein
VIVKKAKKYFKKCPVYPLQFDILKIEREKRKFLIEGAPKGAPSVFWAKAAVFRKLSVHRMKKSKPKAAAAKKPAKKKSVRVQKPANPMEMRQSVTDMVESEMQNITHAVVEEAKKGQLATVKYLFEVSGVYPSATEQSQGKPEEGETLARMLLTRLGLPLEPANSSDDEWPVKVPTSAATRAGDDLDTAEDQRKEAGGRSEPELDDIDEGAVVSVS